ncbi:translation initiation factor 2 [Ureibacillus composti]
MNSYNNFNASNNFNNSTNNNGPILDDESTAAKLAILGAFLATLGDAISTYAAVLALEGIQRSKSNNNEKDNNDDRINELEKQIKYLTKEINKQKKGYK